MNEQEKQQARRAAVLIVAALLYTRAPGGKPAEIMQENAKLAFDFGEIFVDEAIARGYDVASIAELSGAL